MNQHAVVLAAKDQPRTVLVRRESLSVETPNDRGFAILLGAGNSTKSRPFELSTPSFIFCEIRMGTRRVFYRNSTLAMIATLRSSK